MRYKLYIDKRWDRDGADIYLLEYSQEKSYYLTMTDGLLIRNEMEEGTRPDKPFLTLNLYTERILEAFTEGLKQAGYVAEVDNAQRITSEAVAEERKEQIGWLRGEIEKQL